MYSRLDRFKNWEVLAVRAKYSARRLVTFCRISERQLERYFNERFGCCLHVWIRNLRLTKAAGFLKAGKSLKRVALELHYRQYTHFARDFKDHFGLTPSQFQHSETRSKGVNRPYRRGFSAF